MNITVAAPTTDEILAMVGLTPAACDAAIHQFQARRHGRAMRNGRSMHLSNALRLRSTTTPLELLYGNALDSIVEMQNEIDSLDNPILGDVLGIVSDGVGGVCFGENDNMY